MRIAFALPLDLEDTLIGEAIRHGHEVVARCGSADELGPRLADVDAAVVAASPRYLTQRLLALADEVGVRLVALALDAPEQGRVRSLGLDEVIQLPTEWRAVQTLLESPRGGGPVTRAPSSPGTVVAVWGPAGAPGRTTVAVSLAGELAAAGRSVVLCDVDTHAASVAPALGLLDEAPGFAAACRLAGADALTRDELERIAERYVSPSSQFRVLTGLGRPSRWPELSPERIERTLRACRAWADVVVVDVAASLEHDEELSSDLFAPRRNAATVTALSEADAVVAVCAGDPVGLSRFLRTHVDLLEVVEPDRVRVLVNRVRASAVGLQPGAQIAQTLARFGGFDAPALVPYDRAAVDAAVLSGRVLADVAPKSPARLALRDFARREFAPPEEHPRARRMSLRPRSRVAATG